MINQLQSANNSNIVAIDSLNSQIVSLNNQIAELTLQLGDNGNIVNNLNKKISKLEESLNYDLKTIGSMKEDEVRAREQLDNIKNLLKKAKNRIRLYNIPVIPDNYFVELQDASDAIKEIQKELNKKPHSCRDTVSDQQAEFR